MTKNSRLGLALIITAPSGTGKSTLIKRLLAEFASIGFSISVTTRAPRPGEKDGVDYHFVSVEAFKVMLGQGHFAEWAEVHGNFYGTPLAAVRDLLAQGRDVLFDIDVQGAKALKASLGLGRTVFLLPPSRQALVDRLGGRGSDSQETIAKRISNARGEIAQAQWFDHLIVNDDLDQACDELRAVYLAERSTPVLHPGLVEDVLQTWPQAQNF